MTFEAREKKLKAANRVLLIREEILDLINEARRLAKTHIESKREIANLERYVFEQLAEHLEATNPYNKDLSNVARAIVAEAEEDFGPRRGEPEGEDYE